MVKRFLLETSDKKEIELPQFGKQMSSKGIIGLQNNREVSYQVHIVVQSKLISIYNEIRNDYSKQFFKTDFDKLDENKRKIIKDLVPQRISEAEPKM